MPELPEVETVARQLRPLLVGRTITGARVLAVRTLGGESAAAFTRGVKGLCIDAVRRRAKFVVCDVSRGGRPAGALIVHLRMTGRLHVVAPETPRGAYLRVALALDDGRELRFDDVRRFGRFVRARDADAFLDELGPEPLGDAFDAAWLARELAARRRALKPLLLDQTFLAGLGNIYVDEALHRAGLHPLRRSDRVPRERVAPLHDAIRAVLTEAIEREGSSFDVFYRTPEGSPGRFQDEFRVYGRDGQPCRTCGATLVRIVVGQRGTHLCPRCQRAPRVPGGAGGSTRPRRARPSDVAAIARVHVDAWRAAYAGLVPQAHLDALSVENRRKLWERLIRTPPDPRHATFVSARGDAVLGFADAGPARGGELDPDRVGEVTSIYLRPDVVGTGLGRALMAHALRHLARRGFREAVVWVLEGNERARRFYRAAGFVEDGGRTVWRGSGAELPEIRARRPLP